MAIALASTDVVLSTYGTANKTGTVVIAAGEALIIPVAGAANSSGSIIGITDTLGNTYNEFVAAKTFDGAVGYAVQVFYCNPTTTGSTTVTVTGRSSIFTYVTWFRHYTGLLTSSPTDVAKGATATTATPSSGASAVTAQASELVIGVVASESSARTITVGAGYGNLNTQSTANDLYNVATEDKIVAATGAQTATFGLSGTATWICVAATFKAAASAAGPTSGFFPFMQHHDDKLWTPSRKLIEPKRRVFDLKRRHAHIAA